MQSLLKVRPTSKESVDAFTRGLSDGGVKVSRQAAVALTAVGPDGGALLALLRALGNADVEVVRAADSAFQKVAWNLEQVARSGPGRRPWYGKAGGAGAASPFQVVITLGKIGMATGAAGHVIPGGLFLPAPFFSFILTAERQPLPIVYAWGGNNDDYDAGDAAALL